MTVYQVNPVTGRLAALVPKPRRVGVCMVCAGPTRAGVTGPPPVVCASCRVVTCIGCGVRFDAKRARHGRLSQRCQACRHVQRAPRQQITKACTVCGWRFTTTTGSTACCSAACQRATIIPSRGRPARRGPANASPVYFRRCAGCGAIQSSRARSAVFCPVCATSREADEKARRNEAAAVVPELIEIVERDGSDCHVCGEPVDLSLPRRSRWGATLDHVVPLVCGGTDDTSNLRLAHLACNSRRGTAGLPRLGYGVV